MEDSSYHWLQHLDPCPTCGAQRYQPCFGSVPVGRLGIHDARCDAVFKNPVPFLRQAEASMRELGFDDVEERLDAIRNLLNAGR